MTFHTRQELKMWFKLIVYYVLCTIGYLLVGVVILGAIATMGLLIFSIIHEPVKILTGVVCALLIVVVSVIGICLFEWSKR